MTHPPIRRSLLLQGSQVRGIPTVLRFLWHLPTDVVRNAMQSRSVRAVQYDGGPLLWPRGPLRMRVGDEVPTSGRRDVRLGRGIGLGTKEACRRASALLT